jgi:hypothetical protein
MGAEEKREVPVDDRNRLALAYLSLSRDKMFFRMSEKKRLKLIQSVLSFGDSVARGVENEFGTSDPREITQVLGLQVIGEDRGIQGSMFRRSEYRPRSKEIVIFRDSLKQLMREVATEDLSDRLMKLLIAHELFHHFEHTRFGPISSRFKVKLVGVGPLSFNIKLSPVGEVAAHAFAETLLDIKQSPMVFDYLTYIFYSGRRRY